MSVILHPCVCAAWLDIARDPGVVKYLFKPNPPSELTFRPVTTTVNMAAEMKLRAERQAGELVAQVRFATVVFCDRFQPMVEHLLRIDAVELGNVRITCQHCHTAAELAFDQLVHRFPDHACPFCREPFIPRDVKLLSREPFAELQTALTVLQQIAMRVRVEFIIPQLQDSPPVPSRVHDANHPNLKSSK